MAENIESANGAFLAFELLLGGATSTAEECHEYYDEYEVAPGYYVAGLPPFSVPYTPFKAVIDLSTGILVGRDINIADYLTAPEILDLVQAANGE